jgi:hypothetical protein
LNEAGKPDAVAGRTLLFVHGRDFKPAPDVFMELSMEALRVGVERDYPDFADEFAALDKRIAYYGDITDDFLSSQGLRYDEMLDIGDRRNALIKLRSFERRKQFGVARYDRLPGKNAIPEFAADVFAPLLARLGLSRSLINKVGIDLAEYWNRDSDFGERIRERVRSALCLALEYSDQVMLISHGTGCIVTYDVLWQLSHEPEYADRIRGRKVESWITIGAPLGDSMVKKRLMGAKRKGLERFPSNVVSWHNLSAEDDFVSHDNTLGDDFRKMLRQREVSSIRDYRIYNMTIRYGKSNPHSSLGYLVHPRMSQIIVEWLQQPAIQG